MCQELCWRLGLYRTHSLKVLFNPSAASLSVTGNLFNLCNLSSKSTSQLLCFPFLSPSAFTKISPMCRCLERSVTGQMCFLFRPYAVHHMGMSIFHLGHPYYRIRSCLTVTLAHFQHGCFLFLSTKSLWFGLLCPRCIHLDSFPQEAWGRSVVESETNAQYFL